MKKKQLFRGLFGAVLALSLSVPASAAFSDTEGHWAQEAITKWSEKYSILQGYDDGTFRPDQSITRGAFAGILDRFLKFQEMSEPEVFSDIAGNFWEGSILKLHASGVYLGNDGKALASNTITRQQAVTMLARAFHMEPETVDLPYLDADQVAEYAEAYISEMTYRGYITDCEDGYFRPLDPITRAEFLNILNHMIDVLVTDAEPVSGDAEGTVLVNSAEGAVLQDMYIPGDLILAPGVADDVLLIDVAMEGNIINFSQIEPTIITLEEPEEPEEPEKPEVVDPILPEEVYTPGKTTGTTFLYDGKKIPVYKGVEKNTFEEGDFVWDGDRLKYTGRDYRTRFGIDVSAFQNRATEDETIDWDAVREDGVNFVMVRVGFRGTGTGSLNADAYYQQNIEGAMKAGLETGAYFFAQAITVEEAIEEAEYVLELLDGLELDGPIAYDWEMHDSSYRVYGTSPEMATACAIAFCQRIEEAGYDAMIYAGQYVSYLKYDQGAIEPYLSWYPEYKRETSESLLPSLYYHMDYWQFSDRCTIDGIGGRVDGNLRFIPR